MNQAVLTPMRMGNADALIVNVKQKNVKQEQATIMSETTAVVLGGGYTPAQTLEGKWWRQKVATVRKLSFSISRCCCSSDAAQSIMTDRAWPKPWR